MIRAATTPKGPCTDFQVFWDCGDEIIEVKGEKPPESQRPCCLSKAINAWPVVCLYGAKGELMYWCQSTEVSCYCGIFPQTRAWTRGESAEGWLKVVRAVGKLIWKQFD